MAEGQQDVSNLSGRRLRGPERLRVTTRWRQTLPFVCEHSALPAPKLSTHACVRTHTHRHTVPPPLSSSLLFINICCISDILLLFSLAVFFPQGRAHRPSHFSVNDPLSCIRLCGCLCVSATVVRASFGQLRRRAAVMRLSVSAGERFLGVSEHA